MHGFGRRPSLVKPPSGQRTLRADDDKRFAPRRGGRTPAIITFEGAHETIHCFILDMSTTGARIELRHEAGNPFLSRWNNVDRIWVVVRSDRVMCDCLIVRRGDTDQVHGRAEGHHAPFPLS